MFKKINLDLRGIAVERLKGPFMDAYGSSFQQYFIKDPEYLNDLVSRQIKFNIPPSLNCYTEISDHGAIIPHTDTSMTVLNYYIMSSKCVTIFWRSMNPENRILIPQERGDQNESVSKTYSYDPRDLRFVSALMTKNHEAYLLDIHQIHSVKKNPTAPNRAFIRWLWYDVPFNEVLDSITVK